MKNLEDLRIKDIRNLIAAHESYGDNPLSNMEIVSIQFDPEIVDDGDGGDTQRFAVQLCADDPRQDNNGDEVYKVYLWVANEEDICELDEIDYMEYLSGEWLSVDTYYYKEDNIKKWFEESGDECSHALATKPDATFIGLLHYIRQHDNEVFHNIYAYCRNDEYKYENDEDYSEFETDAREQVTMELFKRFHLEWDDSKNWTIKY